MYIASGDNRIFCTAHRTQPKAWLFHSKSTILQSNFLTAPDKPGPTLRQITLCQFIQQRRKSLHFWWNRSKGSVFFANKIKRSGPEPVHWIIGNQRSNRNLGVYSKQEHNFKSLLSGRVTNGLQDPAPAILLFWLSLANDLTPPRVVSYTFVWKDHMVTKKVDNWFLKTIWHERIRQKRHNIGYHFSLHTMFVHACLTIWMKGIILVCYIRIFIHRANECVSGPQIRGKLWSFDKREDLGECRLCHTGKMDKHSL